MGEWSLVLPLLGLVLSIAALIGVIVLAHRSAGGPVRTGRNQAARPRHRRHCGAGRRPWNR